MAFRPVRIIPSRNLAANARVLVGGRSETHEAEEHKFRAADTLWFMAHYKSITYFIIHWRVDMVSSGRMRLISVALLVARRTNNRKVVGSMPASANIVCITGVNCPLWPATTPSSEL